MKFLKTKFYPVDVDNRIIYIDPKSTDSEIFKSYKPEIIGIKGERLMKYPAYSTFRIIKP